MFDPTKPADDSDLSSAEMRGQLNALNDDIQTRQTAGQLNSAIDTALQLTSNNSNGVGTLNLTADGSYQQWQLQAVSDKLDELINALRRSGPGP